MFGSSMLDIAIGVVFVFLLLSIFATALNEIILSWMNMRGKFLLRGIQSLMNEDVDGKPLTLVTQLYNHGQICGLYKDHFDLSTPDKAKTTADNLPSYIPSRNFALALLETTKEHLTTLQATVAAATSIAANAATALANLDPKTHPERAAEARAAAETAVKARQEAETALAKAQAAVTQVQQTAAANAQAAAQTLHGTQQPQAGPAPGTTTVVLAAKDVVAISQAMREGAAALAANTATEKVGKPLVSMIALAGDDANKLQKSVEDWYNSAMDRVSGWYKYHTQKVLFTLGIVIAIAVNANTLYIVRQLSKDSTLRASIVAAAKSAPPSQFTGATATLGNTSTTGAPANPAAQSNDPVATMQDQIKAAGDTVNQLNGLGLPLGWHLRKKDVPDWRHALQPHYIAIYGDHLLGWLLTAIAISLGAPFWFDALNKIMVIRSTVKPTEKSPNEPSKS